jgi:hypothetical protein
LWPQPVGPAVRDAPGAARALVGGGLRDRHHVQPREAAVRIEARLTCKAAVDHHAHAGQGHRRFRDIGGEHHSATAIAAWLQHARLLFDGEFAVQGQHLDDLTLRRCPVHRLPSRQRGLQPHDLAPPRQEHQHVAGMRGQRVLDRTLRLLFDRLLAARRKMRDRDRKAAPRAGKPRRSEETGEFFAIQGRRHDHDPQVLAQAGLHVQRQRQAKVASQVALVEFVEQDRADALEQRIVLQHAGEDALGHDFDAGFRRDLVLEADAVTHGLADRLAQLPGHEAGSGARGDAARFQHHDLAALQPIRIQQRQRHLRGLARARRRFQHQPRMPRQRGMDLRQQIGDRERAV